MAASTLLDIAPQYDVVTIKNRDEDLALRVYGLTAGNIASLIFRFPEIRDVFTAGIGSLDGATVARLGDPLTGALIACALRQADNEAYEEKGRELGVTDQVAILKPCWDRTFPKGVQDFLETLGMAAPAAE